MASIPHITSKTNTLVLKLRSLHTPKGRRELLSFLIEGPHLIEEALRAGIRPDALLYDPENSTIATLAAQFATRAPINIATAPPAIIDHASDAQTPQGIVAQVAIAAIAPETLRQRRPSSNRSVIVILDDVRDPGNAGTIMRTALAMDVDELWLTPACVDFLSPKVVRAAAGAHFHLPCRAEMTWDAIATRIASGTQIALADSAATKEYTALDFTQPTALIVSNEAHGPTDEARYLATHPILIPMANGVESLNAAVAASIVLAESMRQQRASNH